MNWFTIAFIIIFSISIIVTIFFYIWLKVKLNIFKNDLFEFKRYILLINVPKKTLELRVFEKKDNFYFTKSFKIEDFLKSFSSKNTNSKEFFNFLKKIKNFDFSNENFRHKEIIEKWDFFNHVFFFYSIQRTLLGKNVFANIKIDTYSSEDDVIYMSGFFINLKKTVIEKLFSNKNVEILDSDQIFEFLNSKIQKKNSNKNFIVNVFDDNIHENNNEASGYKYFVIYMFALWLKQNKYENVYFTNNYDIFIITNKYLYKNKYLNNKYWLEKMRIIYDEFLEDLQIKNVYNNIDAITSYEFIENEVNLTKAMINFSIMKDFIWDKREINYTSIISTIDSIYKYEKKFLKMDTSDLVIQKEFKKRSTQKNSYILLSISLNLNAELEIKPKYFMNSRLIYEKFFEEVEKICLKNKDKIYKVIIPIKIFHDLDLSNFNDIINVRIYIEAFNNEDEYLNFSSYLSNVNLNNKRFGIYVNEVSYAWDFIRMTNPKYIWVSNNIFKNKKYNLKVEYFFEKIKYYSLGEKIILENN